jgi:hypothetical protein
MNTKEKLELLWKYLFLLVVAIGVIRFTNGSHSAKLHFGHGDDHDMLFVGDDKVFFDADDHKMDVKVEKEIVDGDTLVKMWINGEEVDAEEHDMKDGSFKWKSKDGNVMVIDIDDDHHDGTHKKEKYKKVIKKKIVIKDEN